MKGFASGFIYVVVALTIVSGTDEMNDNGIRLVGGRNSYEGRVEIFYDGEWLTVCDDYFFGSAADVMCRMLGFSSAIGFKCCSEFGQGTGDWMLKIIDCDGSELNITDCTHDLRSIHEPGSHYYSSDSKYYCDHDEDVGLECDPSNVEVNQLDIRLVGGQTPFEGRVEIYYDGSWATVCDELIRWEEAHMLCRMLGYVSASSFECCSEFGRGVGDNVIRDIKCQGTELNITECEYSHAEHQPGYSSSDYGGRGEIYCDHSDDLGLVCIPGEVRLRNSSERPGHKDGRVEVRQGHIWNAVCYEAMDLNLAIVLCHMLGYHTAQTYYEIETVNPEGAVHNISYVCRGDEDTLADCVQLNRDAVNNTFCRRLAGITCASLPVRLVSREKGEGRVEVFHGRSWSPICFTSWTITAADVVCRMLGYNGASTAFRDEEILDGPSVGDVLGSVQCNGTERNIAHCNLTDLKRVPCVHDGYAAARCTGKVTVPVRLSGGEDPSAGRVELFYYGSWGTVCASDDPSSTSTPQYAMNIANVVCRMLGFPRALSYECCGHFGQGFGGIYLDTLKCTGKESNILDCPQSKLGLHRRCNHFMDLGVTCQKKVEYKIRLNGGGSKLEGRVAVYQPAMKKWGTICDDNWDLTDADVVCRMLGYERAESYSCCSKYGKVSSRKPIVLDEVECDGSETNIGHCLSYDRHDCTHDEDAGVKCVDWETPTVHTQTKTATDNMTTESLMSTRKATHNTQSPLTLSGRTFALVISQVVYIVVALFVIALLTTRLHRYRRRAMATNTIEIPLTGTDK